MCACCESNEYTVHACSYIYIYIYIYINVCVYIHTHIHTLYIPTARNQGCREVSKSRQSFRANSSRHQGLVAQNRNESCVPITVGGRLEILVCKGAFMILNTCICVCMYVREQE
jgi:hypothetical protein